MLVLNRLFGRYARSPPGYCCGPGKQPLTIAADSLRRLMLGAGVLELSQNTYEHC